MSKKIEYVVKTKDMDMDIQTFPFNKEGLVKAERRRRNVERYTYFSAKIVKRTTTITEEEVNE